MKPGEVIVGGIWAASAVKVAGYTWKVAWGGYQQFPGIGGDSSGSTGFISGVINDITNLIPGGIGLASNVIGAGLNAGKDFFGSLFG